MADSTRLDVDPDVDSDVDLNVDVVVVGAGFAGLYLLQRLRERGLSAIVLEQADDVGGTWYWNRYPGARCDIPTTDYTFGFDPELEAAWQWSEKYATQPEILDYLRFVADRYDLRRDIRFSTKVVGADWDEARQTWRVRTDAGDPLTCRYLVMASGCLSVPKVIDIPGAEAFAGETYLTGRWPRDGVDLTGKRVAVIGTGSSGVQSIPLIAQQASALTVFQRTPNFAVPAHNGPPPADRVERLAADRETYRQEARRSRGGVPREVTDVSGTAASPEVRRERFEQAWADGELFAILGVFADQGVDLTSNEIVAEMIREKIRERVDDPATAEALCPTDHPFGTKRPCLDSGYFETFNRDNVRLVDLRRSPIARITERGIQLAGDETVEVDVIVYATGFDAMTGALVAVDITGAGGRTLRQAWAEGPSTYLGLMTVGFPNLFAITGPGSPSVLSNMAVSIEQHVEWVTDALVDLRADGLTTIEPTRAAQAGWDQHAADCAALTLHVTADSWYMGANVPGKPRVLYPYIGGVDAYRAAAEEVTARGYLGFVRSGPAGIQVHDGVVRRLQPDVSMVLDAMALMELPPLESLSAPDARALMDAAAALSPPGPEVGEIADGTLPGAAGPLAYRLYRPATVGPHPVVVWFHGGGWVLGSAVSDDPLCRDLCARSGALVVSVDYRHAPETRFPAAADDAYAAVCWLAEHVEELAGAGPLVVAGWSAGANLAAVSAQRARDDGGPALAGQLLLCPVTDSDFSRPSYTENAEGYALTTATMRWFWDCYADPADRSDPRAAPLRGELAGLPPAVVVTAEMDPLRDEGDAYADALAAAGVRVEHIRARGHVHTSLTQVDLVLSGAPVRAEIVAALRSLLAAPIRV